MYSVNVPVPGTVARLASDLHPFLLDFDRVREDYTLLAKRIGDPEHFSVREHEVRRALRGQPAFEVQVTGLGCFEQPTKGTAPVVYFEVESPGLLDLHERLVDEFGAIGGLEGEDYVPHVTIARDAPQSAADRLLEQEIEPVTWTVNQLEIFDSRYREVAARINLPG